MARSISEIQVRMVEAIKANQILSGQLTSITSTSKTSIARLFTFIVATAIWMLEVFFDQHKKEVDEKLANQKSGTLPWYRTMALRFQKGFDLVKDEDYFDNRDKNGNEIGVSKIEASKIVKYAAVNESPESSRVIIKIAGEDGDGVLAPISESEKEAFETYINEIKVAGVKVSVLNYKPDLLTLSIQIKRDAMLLNSTGMRIKDGEYPVIIAIQEFMKELPFDGDLRLSALVDKLQSVEGVLDATVVGATSAWINPETGDYGKPLNIFISTIPFSGYFKITDFKGVEYVV
ncbi:nucleotidyltransferase [Flavobacterium sp. F-65]|jgi:hypothetical protein|uniref:Nucleotidyltransferase n=1 Tax=Flavobacterium pisciphilum TaxID=2893755 RepID=A0ABS8MR28_9FLAO|nr:nucleotidyltransferase [Flavobacterium sp. F-65]MCC9071209.1 nucleotidyltransferase [Flavobacterium sp. F-65]